MLLVFCCNCEQFLCLLFWNFSNSFTLLALIKGFTPMNGYILFLLLWLKNKSILLEVGEFPFFDFHFIWWQSLEPLGNDTDCYLHEPQIIPLCSFLPVSFSTRAKTQRQKPSVCWDVKQTPADSWSCQRSLLSLGKENGAWARERESQRNVRIICSAHSSFKSRDVNNVYNPVLKLYYNVLMIKSINNLHKDKNNWCETYCKKNENSNHRLSH